MNDVVVEIKEDCMSNARGNGITVLLFTVRELINGHVYDDLVQVQKTYAQRVQHDTTHNHIIMINVTNTNIGMSNGYY